MERCSDQTMTPDSSIQIPFLINSLDQKYPVYCRPYLSYLVCLTLRRQLRAPCGLIG